jgi:hypothetical protein
MCPWVPAKEIVENFHSKDAEYFYTKILGLPYVGSGNKVTEDVINRNLTSETNDQSGRIVIGVDTGAHVHYVIGNQQGLFHYGESDNYSEIEGFLKRWPRSIIVFDAGGDLITPRMLREKYRGRVYLCHYRRDRKTMQLIRWGKGEEEGNVVVDRNRMIQVIVDEFTDKRIPIFGTKEEWWDFYTHWANMRRVDEVDSLGVMEKKWERVGPDHWAHACVYWRAGMAKFGFGNAEITGEQEFLKAIPKSYEISPMNTVPLIIPDKSFNLSEDDDD